MPVKTAPTVDWTKWIANERKRQGWSQAELARRADTTRATINDYERGRRSDPDPTTLASISLALGFDAEHLPVLAGQWPDRRKESRAS